jgi:uncharacterized protein YcbX
VSRRQIGRVQALWRYPVKSLRGEEVAEAEITDHGVLGDRLMALRELDRGGIMSARFWSAMLELNARYDASAPTIESGTRIDFPDGRAMRTDDPALPKLLSDLFGRAIQLEKVRRDRMTEAELAAVIRGETLPPSRDFFDEDVIHIIASGTLAHLRSLEPDSDFDPRRFRANIYVDTGDEADGFIEDRWLGGALEIGLSVRIDGLSPSIRCAITTHPQAGLRHDPAILRAAWQHHRACVGVFASVGAPGQVRIGDPVVLTMED